MEDGSPVSIRWDRGYAISLNRSGQLGEQELLEHLDGALLLAEQGIKAIAVELKSLPCFTELPSDLRAQLQS